MGKSLSRSEENEDDEDCHGSDKFDRRRSGGKYQEDKRIYIERARKLKADLVAFPEMVVTGYPFPGSSL